MSLDLQPLLALGADLVAQAVNTSGTTVNLARNPGGARDATVDRATLAMTDPDPATTLATGLPAIVIPEQAAAEQPAGPNLPGQVDAYKVILLPDVTDVRARDQVTIATSLDARLAGRTIVVRRVEDNTAGVARVLHCEAP